MKVRRSLLKDTVLVRTRTGESGVGPTYADQLRAQVLVDETRRMVRDGNGDETVSEATLTCHPRTLVLDEDEHPDHVDPLELFAPESLVTIGGRASRVLTSKAVTMRGYVVQVEVTCA